jgi:hypothetical protein
MERLDLDAIGALFEALDEPVSSPQLEDPPTWNWDDLDELMSGYATTQDDNEDALLRNLEADDVDVDPDLVVELNGKFNTKRNKRKVTEALRLEKHGVEVEPVSKRRFLYHFEQETVTSHKAAMRLCTAAETGQTTATQTATTAPEPREATPELE